MQAYRGALPPGSAPRRGPMMPQQAMHPQQMQAQAHVDHLHERQLRDRARLRSDKPVDRTLPDDLDRLVLGDGVEQYTALRDLERRIDANMMRKRFDIQDSIGRNSKRHGTLRIWVSNTVEDQPWQASGMDPNAFDFSSGVEAKFRVKLVGKLLGTDANAEPVSVQQSEPSTSEPSGDHEPASKRAKLSSPGPVTRSKLSHFFKAVSIDFDRPGHLQPDGYTRIEWKRPDINLQSTADLPKEADFDCLEFERKSDENINITIKLYRDEQPERYRLDPDLAQLLDMQEADRATVLMGIWEYIKQNNLPHDPEGRQAIKSETLYFPHLPDRLKNVLFERPPLELQYTIRVDKTFHEAPGGPAATVYDICVPLDDSLASQMRSTVTATSHKDALQQINSLDSELAMTVQAMNQSKAKHGFFTSMSKDPANFVQRWVSSQRRDLDVIKGAGAWGEEDWQDADWRKGGDSGPWSSVEAAEGVGSFLTRRDTQRA